MKRIAIFVLVALPLPAGSLADIKEGEKKAQLCLLCHKATNAAMPMSKFPLLEAQPATYLYLQMKAYKEQRRDGTAMQINTANLSDRDMRDIANYLSAQKSVRVAFVLDPAKIAVGKTRADELKCAACHLPTFHGTGEIPRLAGQTPGYLKAQLAAFGSGKRRHGTDRLTAPTAALNEQEIEALAHFAASLE